MITARNFAVGPPEIGIHHQGTSCLVTGRAGPYKTYKTQQTAQGTHNYKWSNLEYKGINSALPDHLLAGPYCPAQLTKWCKLVHKISDRHYPNGNSQF